MTTTDTRDTKEKILDAAEQLFADHGFAATSLRAITAGADVNLAAVNYHFGSKDSLIQDVFERRLAPLNRERLELLDRLESEAGDEAPSLEGIVEAFVGPALRMGRDPDRGGPAMMRLLGHIYSEPGERIEEQLHGQFEEVGERFTTALGRALPELSPAEVFWRLMFIVGSMLHTMAMCEHLSHLLGDKFGESTDADSILRHMVPFLVAGLQAPPPMTNEEGSR